MTKLIVAFRHFAKTPKNWDELRRKWGGLLINLTPHLRLNLYGLQAMTTGNALHIVVIFIRNLCAFLVIPCVPTHITTSYKNEVYDKVVI